MAALCAQFVCVVRTGGQTLLLRAQVPLAEMFNYVSNLRSMTKGRGQYVMQLGDYRQVPPNIQEEIVAANKVTA
jgi:elongation factor G